jgi:ACS family tartrate transporter-like MFS transporter
VERSVIRKLTWRIVPLLGLVYVISFLDRVNLGFAALTMNKDLRIDAVEYGSAAGVFFIGYLAFQIPANFLLTRLGARHGVAAVNTVGGLGGFAGPVIVGWAKQNGGFPLALLILGAGLVIGAAIAVAASRPIRQAAPDAPGIS